MWIDRADKLNLFGDSTRDLLLGNLIAFVRQGLYQDYKVFSSMASPKLVQVSTSKWWSIMNSEMFSDVKGERGK